MNLNLIPLDTNTRVRDSKSLFLLGSLDLDLHDAFLEKGAVEIEVSCSEVDVVLSIVLMFVEVETGMDGVFVDGEGVRHNIIGGQEVVGVRGVCLLTVPLGELRESVAEFRVNTSVLDVLHVL